jgi:alpha-galactosidase
MHIIGVSIDPGQIQSIYDAGLVLNANSYPAFGLQTVGEKAIAITQPDGNMSLDLAVDAVTQYTSKDGEITEVLLKDKIYPVWVKQCNKAYKGTDIITTWVEIGNAGKKPVTLFQFASAYLPMFRGDNWLTHFHGAWGAEHTMDEEKLTNGQKVIANKDGLANTETDNPSFMLSLDGKPQEETGKVFGAFWLGVVIIS